MIDHQHWVFLVPATLFIVDNSIRLISILVVPRNRTPSSGTAWLLFILLAPIPGFILFWLIGGTRMPRRRRERQNRAIELMSDIAERDAQQFGSDLGTLPLGLGNAEKLGLALGAQPMFRGNHATVSHISEDSLSLMATEIRAASTFVHIEFYILSYDDSTHDVFDAIREATSRGVTVRVMLDHIATMRQPRPSDTTRKLDAVGAEWTYMLPVRPWRGQWQRPDLRNHRKILVVDGVVGFIGSQNMVDSSYNKRGNIRRGLQWRDIMVRLTGPSVSSLNRVFMSDWYQETGQVLPDTPPRRAPENSSSDTSSPALSCQVLPSGPGFGNENNLQVFIALMGSASHRISITSPYFVPDQAIMYVLRAATARGVAVELFVSEIGDQPLVFHAQRSYYEELLSAGVRIFMFSPPYILHSKHFSIDDSIAVVGSSNMDQRSFNLNMEISMIVNGASFVDQLDRVNDFYHQNSRELTREEWSTRPIRSQVFDGLARLTSALE